jgi:hypothetical protein
MSRSASDWAGNIAAFIVVVAVNAMANGVPLGGQTTGEISAKYPSLFTPSGATFSIWGLIYLSLLVFVVYQALPAQRDDAKLAQLSVPFQVNCVANAAWIFFWHYDFLVLSLVCMLLILGSLVVIFRNFDHSTSLLVKFPFSVYTGWITVATIANISVLQTAYELNDWGLTAVQWTWLKLAVAGAIGAIVIAKTRNVAYVLVIAWAAYGIYVKQAAIPEVSGAAITLALLATLLAAYASVAGFKTQGFKPV